MNLLSIWRRVFHLSSGRSFVYTALLLSTSFSCSPHNNSESDAFDPANPGLTTESAGALSTRAFDTGESFNMGFGYDMLSGERHGDCAIDKLKFIATNINRSLYDFQIVTSREELANSLGVIASAEASGTYGSIGATASSKSDILRVANFDNNSFVAVYKFSFEAQNISIRADSPVLKPEMEDLLLSDKAAFRMLCGDRYTQSIVTGAVLHIIINAKSKKSSEALTQSYVNSLKGTVGSIFSANVSADVKKTAVKILSDYTTDASCFSYGLSSEPCSTTLTTIDPSNIDAFLKFVGDASRIASSNMNSSLSSPSTGYFTAISETFKKYEKPKMVPADTPYLSVFFDFADHQKIVNDLWAKEDKVNEICEVRQLNGCVDVAAAIHEQVDNCAHQKNWIDCKPEKVDAAIAKALANQTVDSTDAIGKVILYKHWDSTRRRGYGTSVLLDFDRPTNSVVFIKPNEYYNLEGDYSFQSIASSYQSSLRPGWILRLFSKENGEGDCYLIKGMSAIYKPIAYVFHDKARSFRLEKEGQYPLITCN